MWAIPDLSVSAKMAELGRKFNGLRGIAFAVTAGKG
jgi:hypothetical protein